MIESPDPAYLNELEQIPPELIEFMDAGYDIDEKDLIADMLRLPLEERRELYAKIKKFLSLPPTEFQLHTLAFDRGTRYEPEATQAIVQGVCDRLELSLRAAP